MCNGSMGFLYTSRLGAIYKDEIFVMFGAHVATGTIMTSQLNAVASP